MSTPDHPWNKIPPLLIVTIEFALYAVMYAVLFEHLGFGIGILATIPIISASWYFGVRSGIVMAILIILTNITVLYARELSFVGLFNSPGNLTSSFVNFLIAIIVGRLGGVTRDQNNIFSAYKDIEEKRQRYTDFLEALSDITSIALEAGDLKGTLNVLVEKIGKLFQADDCFFAFWDDETKTTIPMAAYGSMREIYPTLAFEPSERTLASLVLEAGHPIAIQDFKSSPEITPKIKSAFSSKSVLGIPLFVGGSKIASFFLGYDKPRSFNADEITYAEYAAQQVSIVLAKTRLLDESQKKVRQLTTLHEVAMVSTQVGTIDQLIERVTEIIGRNLFPDNFGILLMNESEEMLYPHPSYHFMLEQNLTPKSVSLNVGITGLVGKTGKPIRIGNIKTSENYINVDQRTVSELCVPIMIKGRILGVINTESGQIDAFSYDDESLLGTLASQLATSIEQLRAAQAERKWLDQLAHSNELIYTLTHITSHIEKKHQIDDVIHTLGDELNKIDITSMIAVLDREKQVFRVNYTSLSPRARESLKYAVSIPLEDYTFSMEDLTYRIHPRELTQPAMISNPGKEFQILIPNKLESRINTSLQDTGITPSSDIYRLPLLFEDKLLGIAWLWGEQLTESDLPILSTIANQIGTTIQNAYLFQEIQSLALTDPLTGLHNRRSLFELGKIEFSRAHRMNREFSCMMLDLDHFKKINDTFGHQAGDLVLQEFASHCKKSVRDVDLVGRYGGEEVIILLPETDITTAQFVAERLRKSLEKRPIAISNHELNLTVSIGIAGKDDNTLGLETLIARADQAMYIAKHKGRNQIAVSV